MPHRHGEHSTEPPRGVVLQGPSFPARVTRDAYKTPGGDLGNWYEYNLILIVCYGFPCVI